MEETRKYLCNDCHRPTWSTIVKGCSHCTSQNLIPFVDGIHSNTNPEDMKKAKEALEALRKEEMEEKRVEGNWIKGCLFVLALVLVILLFIGEISITSDGCSLPIDLVIGDMCVFGSFGGSLAATLASVIVLGILGFIANSILNIFRK